MAREKRPKAVKKTSFIYEANVTKIRDGDTILVDFDYGDNLFHKDKEIRLAHINTCEMKSENPLESELAKRAKERLEELLTDKRVLLKMLKDDKFGRFVCEVTNSDGVNVNQTLIDEKLALYYEGEGVKDFTSLFSFHFPNKL